MVLIAALIALNTGSIVLTLAGLFEILASLPIAMCVWVMLGQVIWRELPHTLGANCLLIAS